MSENETSGPEEQPKLPKGYGKSVQPTLIERIVGIFVAIFGGGW